MNYFAAFFAVAGTVYFWWKNIKGIHESSGKALRIMQITTVMVVAFLIWCADDDSAARPRARFLPRRCLRNLQFSPTDASAGSKEPSGRSIPMVALIIAFGHSLLSMSGFETLAQVYREIAYPKLKNLRDHRQHRLLVRGGLHRRDHGVRGHDHQPDADIRNLYADNLLGGLAMHLVGPELLKLLFHIFVVIVGVLILSGAVNTSIIGANGVLNRVAEDGVLLDWFRKPHKRFGTTHRIINLIALLQIVTISPAAATCTCWAKRMRSAWCGASS